MTFPDIAQDGAAPLPHHTHDRSEILGGQYLEGIKGCCVIEDNMGKSAWMIGFDFDDTTADRVCGYPAPEHDAVKGDAADGADANLLFRDNKFVNRLARFEKPDHISNHNPCRRYSFEGFYGIFFLFLRNKEEIVYNGPLVLRRVVGYLHGIFDDLVMDKFERRIHTIPSGAFRIKPLRITNKNRNVVLFKDTCMGMDNSIRRRAIREIRIILETAGYDVEEEGDPFDLSALLGKECILALCTDDPDLARHFDQKPFILEEEGEKIRCKKLILTQNRLISPDEGILWNLADLGRYAGEASVARITGERYSIQWTQPGKQEQNQVRQKPIPGHISCLPVHISKKDAISISGEKGEARLRLIPHWAYRYTCAGHASYKGKHINFDAARTGAISAINGLPQDIDPDEATESEILPDAELVRPSIAAKEAEEMIITSIISSLAKRVRIKTESGDAIFSEEKTFKPSREQIERTIWLLYVPVWQVRGRHIVEVNATTGEILSEPMDEGVELL